MLRLKADSAKAVERFIRRSVDSGLIWALDVDGEMVWCPAHEHDAMVVPIFSDRAYAVRGNAAWDNIYEPFDMSLDHFMSCILPKCVEKGILLGPNWDGAMAGAEIFAQELLKQLDTEITRHR